MLAVIIWVLFLLYLVYKVVRVLGAAYMSPEQHREAAFREDRAATVENNAKRAAAHTARAESHRHMADVLERGEA